MSQTQASSIPSVSRVPAGRLALWWVISSEVVLFGGLIACYLLYRIRHPEWGAFAEHTSTPMGALNTLVLLTSSLTVVLAHAAANQRQFQKAFNLLMVTVAFGGVFLVVKGFEYTHEIQHGFTITSHLFWSFYFIMTGLHAFHVICGMIAMTWVAFKVRNGNNPHYVELAGLYWHFVDVVWIFLFPLLYVAQ